MSWSQMLKEDERFKLIDGNFPKIGRQIVQLWGKPGLIAYINSVIDNAKENPALGLATKIELALYGLRKEHEQIYGRQHALIQGGALAEDEDFKTINAPYQRIGRQIVQL